MLCKIIENLFDIFKNKLKNFTTNKRYLNSLFCFSISKLNKGIKKKPNFDCSFSSQFIFRFERFSCFQEFINYVKPNKAAGKMMTN